MLLTRTFPGLIAFALLLSAAPDALGADPRVEAKAEFGQGQRAFEKKDYQAALRHFQRAFELHAHDAVRFNIAVCLEKLGRHREALLQYQAAARSDQLDAKQRDRAERQARAAKAELGTLVVGGQPDGADVLIGGEQLCNLPCSIELDPGKHELSVRSGERSDSRAVFLRKGEKTQVSVKLEASAPAPDEPPELRASDPLPPAPPEPPSASRERGPSWITWAGGGLVVLGGAGVAVFGPQAKSAHDEFVETGSEDARSDGVRARNLTNAAIGVAVSGVILIGLDLLIFARQPEQSSARRGLELAF
jgi:hypothetical protein